MNSFGSAFEILPKDNRSEYVTDPNAIIPAEPLPEKKAFYNNPGFWSKVGAVGSALINDKAQPGLAGLKQAGQFAASYHNAEQLNIANRGMLTNIAAGRQPMEGIDTTGLTADQITGITKTGLGEKDRADKSKLENEQFKNTLLNSEQNRAYQGKLMQQVDESILQKQNKVKRWDETLAGWESGTIKKPTFITDEMIPVLKSMSSDSGDSLIKELMKESAANPKYQVVTDAVGGKVHFLDPKTLTIQKTVEIAPKKNGEGGTKSPLVTKGEEKAFSDNLPALKDAYFKSLGPKEDAARKMAEVMSMLNDPNKAGQVRTTLLSTASKELKDKYYREANTTSESLHSGGGFPVGDTPLPPVGTPGHATLPKGVRPDMEKVRALGKELQGRLGRPATAEEMRDAYMTKFGGK